MTEEDDDLFVSVLRADLPTDHQQDLMRKRLFAAGLSVSSGLATLSATSAAHGGVAAGAASSASLLSKLGALSWPVKLGLAAAVAVPAVSVPLWVAERAAAPSTSTSASVNVAQRAPQHAAAQAVHAIAEPAPAPMSEPAAIIVSEPELPSVAVRRSIERAAPVEPAAVAPALPARDVTPQPAAVAAFAPASPSAGDGMTAQQRATTLAAENALLDRAFAELSAGHRTSAASLIAEHARRFPQGLLRQERERAQARLNAELSRDSKGERGTAP
jgi:hypothetical protein